MLNFSNDMKKATKILRWVLGFALESGQPGLLPQVVWVHMT